MIDFLSISISNFILILLLITVLVFFCLYIYSDNKKLKEQIEELRKENKNLLENKIMKQVDVDSISIKNISNEKNNVDINKKININPKEEITKPNPKKESLNNYSYYNITESNKTNFNIDEYINKSNISSTKKNISNDYLKELSNKIEEELKPRTIELTDYEKKQEEQAVISYKELLKFKDNNVTLDDKQDTTNFIEELKKLRNSLR